MSLAAPPLATGFVVGKHERPHLGPGWWDRQRWPDRPGLVGRATHPRAEFTLMGHPGQTSLHLLLAASVTLIGGPARVEVRCGAAPLGVIEIPFEDWAVHALPCAVEAAAPITFTLHTLTPAVPHRVLRNGDHRELGIHIAAAHLC